MVLKTHVATKRSGEPGHKWEEMTVTHVPASSLLGAYLDAIAACVGL
jgi:hypothetical protein